MRYNFSQNSYIFLSKRIVSRDSGWKNIRKYTEINDFCQMILFKGL